MTLSLALLSAGLLVASQCFSVQAKSVGSAPALSTLEIQLLGQKYPNQPESERLQRLEKVLNLPNNPNQSVAYRLTQLYLAREGASIAQRQQQAIGEYNQGVEAEQAGNSEDAIHHYREALALDPQRIEAYNNLANLLVEAHRYEETRQLYLEALEVNPDNPLLHRNLGVLYEKQGNIQAAIKEYQTYLKISPNPDAPIQAVVENYRSHSHLERETDNYLKATTQSSHGQPLLWPEALNPIRVFVEVKSQNQRFTLPIIQKSLTSWETATNGRLRFTLTPVAEEARIFIHLRDGPLSDPKSQVGHAEYKMPQEQLFQRRASYVRIALNTGIGQSSQLMSEEAVHAEIYRMSLHEVGHAIGIWGHSMDPGDIMFTHPIASDLSERDVRTIRKLYGI